MATGTLVIMEVNLELLEEQRVVLQGITDIELSQVQMEAIPRLPFNATPHSSSTETSKKPRGTRKMPTEAPNRQPTTQPHKFEVFKKDSITDPTEWCKHCNTTKDEIEGMHRSSLQGVNES